MSVQFPVPDLAVPQLMPAGPAGLRSGIPPILGLPQRHGSTLSGQTPPTTASLTPTALKLSSLRAEPSLCSVGALDPPPKLAGSKAKCLLSEWMSTPSSMFRTVKTCPPPPSTEAHSHTASVPAAHGRRPVRSHTGPTGVRVTPGSQPLLKPQLWRNGSSASFQHQATGSYSKANRTKSYSTSPRFTYSV